MTRTNPIWRTHRRTVNVLVSMFTVCALLLVSLAACAQTERELTKPTGWWWYHGQSGTQINNLIQQKQARPISVRVDNTSPLTFTVALVKNSGDYAKKWWWHYGLTPTALAAQLQQNNARLLDIEPYVVNGAVRFAVIMVPNDGTTWWYYYGLAGSNLATRLQQNNGRLIALRSYVQSGQRVYAVIMLKNTGTNARSWSYAWNYSIGQIQSLIASSPARRLIALQRNDIGNYNAIFLAKSGTKWWWYYGVSPDTALTTDAIYRVARIIDVQTYIDNGKQVYLGLMIQN